MKHTYKVLIRVRDFKTKKIIKNRRLFNTYEDVINYINENLNVNNLIKMKFFEDDKSFGYGEIWYQDNAFINYDASLAFLRKLFKKEDL